MDFSLTELIFLSTFYSLQKASEEAPGGWTGRPTRVGKELFNFCVFIQMLRISSTQVFLSMKVYTDLHIQCCEQ